MTQEQLSRSLDDPMAPDRFRDLCRQLRERDRESVFHDLFDLALTTTESNRDAWASSILVELEPPCPLPCDEAIRSIARSEMNLSNRLIPFYLSSQFGKFAVLEADRSTENRGTGPGEE
jgi:hypothetical protein